MMPSIEESDPSWVAAEGPFGFIKNVGHRFERRFFPGI